MANACFSLLCYHLMIPPLIKDIPKTPLPDPNEDPGWYGEFSVRYPLSQTICSIDYGRVFKARNEVSIIINRLACHLFDEDVHVVSGCSPKRFADFAMELMTWYSSLPVQLTPARVVFPSQLKLQ
jgi:hypothetical protein